MVSFAPPAAKATTMRIGLDGYLSAATVSEGIAHNAATASKVRRRTGLQTGLRTVLRTAGMAGFSSYGRPMLLARSNKEN